MPTTREAEIGALQVQGQAGHLMKASHKDQNEGQEHNLVVECLFGISEALSSTPSNLK